MPQQSFIYEDEEGRSARLTVPPGYDAPRTIKLPLLSTMGSGYSLFERLNSPPPETLKGITDTNRENEAAGSLGVDVPDFADFPDLPEASYDPEYLLRRAHTHQEIGEELMNIGESQGQKKRVDGLDHMQHLGLAENLSLLSIAGFLQQIAREE